MSNLPPYPAGDIKEWARQVTAYLQERESGQQEVLPAPVLLETWDDRAKAFTNGIFMFHPTLKMPVISIDGEWVPVAVGDVYRYTYGLRIATASYAAVPGTPVGVDIVVGTYRMDVSATLLGSSVTASGRVRVVQDGTTLYESALIGLDSPSLVTLAAEVAFSVTTAGPVTLDLLGEDCTLQSATLLLTRIP